MATDAEILTAARNYAIAIAELKAADEVVIRLGNELHKAGQIADERRKRATECEQTLRLRSAQKPAEPAAKPEVVVAQRELVAAHPVPTANPHQVPNLSRKR